jgi:hypothetical protein
MNHIASEFGHMMTTNGSTVSPTMGTNGGASAAFSQPWPSTTGAMGNSMMAPAQPFSEPMMPHQSPPQQATDIFLNPADFQMFNFAFPLDNINQYDPQPDFSFGAMPPDMDMDMGDMDMSGLCGGMPEGCPCGDDCACIGCQVHGKPSEVAPVLGQVGPNLWISPQWWRQLPILLGAQRRGGAGTSNQTVGHPKKKKKAFWKKKIVYILDTLGKYGTEENR